MMISAQSGASGREADVGRGLYRPQLVASDLDGTLLPPTLEFTTATKSGVAALQAAGIPFIIITGRMFRSARRMANRLGLHSGPIVCYQGAMIADLASGEWLFHQTMAVDLAAQVIRDMRQIHRHVNVYIGDELYVESLDEWARRYAEYAEVGITTVPDLVEAVEQRPPTKIVIPSDPSDITLLLPQLQKRWEGALYVTRSLPQYIEICDPRVSKSAALARLSRQFGVAREQTVACGDGLNDVDMLQWAGLGVAVAESSPQVRAAADLVVARDQLGGLFSRLATASAGDSSQSR
jgi:Cof subfamily protein (haloacid dehalogenase superfamily)